MNFRENLKEALALREMMVKQLSAHTGISTRTLENYLRADAVMPPADKAVKIAQVLGVSVEFLVTGKDGRQNTLFSAYSLDKQKVLLELDKLGEKDSKLVLDTALHLAKSLQARK
jgi:transcriptional regulator with XRE-family HTH domain